MVLLCFPRLVALVPALDRIEKPHTARTEKSTLITAVVGIPPSKQRQPSAQQNCPWLSSFQMRKIYRVRSFIKRALFDRPRRISVTYSSPIAVLQKHCPSISCPLSNAENLPCVCRVDWPEELMTPSVFVQFGQFLRAQSINLSASTDHIV